MRLDDAPIRPSLALFHYVDYRPQERESAYSTIFNHIESVHGVSLPTYASGTRSSVAAIEPTGRKLLRLGTFIESTIRRLNSIPTDPSMRDLPLISGREQDLAKFDCDWFKSDNQYADGMIELARAQPDCVFILYDAGDRIRAYIDMFFFQPNTFVTDENLGGMVGNGGLPTANDILGQSSLLTPGKSDDWTKGNSVDVYIDAICVEGGNERCNCATALLVEMARKLQSPPFRDVRINRVATIAVSNNDEDVLTVLGQNHTKERVDPGILYSRNGLLTRKYMGSNPAGLSREYFSGEFKRSLFEYGAAWVTRAFRHLLKCHQLPEVREWFNSTDADSVISEC